jgi:hypothetical protein
LVTGKHYATARASDRFGMRKDEYWMQY